MTWLQFDPSSADLPCHLRGEQYRSMARWQGLSTAVLQGANLIDFSDISTSPFWATGATHRWISVTESLLVGRFFFVSYYNCFVLLVYVVVAQFGTAM